MPPRNEVLENPGQIKKHYIGVVLPNLKFRKDKELPNFPLRSTKWLFHFLEFDFSVQHKSNPISWYGNHSFLPMALVSQHVGTLTPKGNFACVTTLNNYNPLLEKKKKSFPVHPHTPTLNIKKMWADLRGNFAISKRASMRALHLLITKIFLNPNKEKTALAPALSAGPHQVNASQEKIHIYAPSSLSIQLLRFSGFPW